MKVEIRAKYMATVNLVVEVNDGDVADPMNPASWKEIVSEYQLDYTLYDVESWKPAGPED
jgi:hypothetical protein